MFKKITSFLLVAVMLFSVTAISVSAEDGDIIVSQKIIAEFEDGTYLVETLSKNTSASPSTRSASGSVTYTKSNDTVDKASGLVVNSAKLTASFTFDEQSNYVDITAADYYFTSSTFYANPSISYSYSGGVLTKYKGTAKLSYTQNPSFNPTSQSITITCNSTGDIS